RIRADEKVELNPRGVVRLGVERQKRDDDAEAEKVDEDRQEDDEENRLPVRDHSGTIAIKADARRRLNLARWNRRASRAAQRAQGQPESWGETWRARLQAAPAAR